MLPLVGSVTLEISFSKVLLPAPLRPRIPTTSPCATSKLTSSRAQNFLDSFDLLPNALPHAKGFRLRISSSRKFSRLTDRPRSYSFERWLTLMMGGGMKYLADQHSHKREALRDDCARILQPKVLNRTSARSFAYFKTRGQPPTNAILGRVTHL